MFRQVQHYKDYSIDNEKENEFSVTIKHPTLIYDELKRFAHEKIANLRFSIIDNQSVKLHLTVDNVNRLDNAHKQFTAILSFLNQNKLGTRDYAEILEKYDQFLTKNNLKQHIPGLQRENSKQGTLTYTFPSGNMAF